jgi:hypothetical protein
MKQLYRAATVVHRAVLDLFRPKENNKERGSMSLEQIIWTVGLTVAAIAVVAIVVAAINSKAAELPGG